MDSLLPEARVSLILSNKTPLNPDSLHPSDARLLVRSNPNPTKSQIFTALLHPSSLAIRNSGNELLRLTWRGSLHCEGLVEEVENMGGMVGLFGKMGIEQIRHLVHKLRRHVPSPSFAPLLQHLITSFLTNSPLPHVPRPLILSLISRTVPEYIRAILFPSSSNNVPSLLSTRAWKLLAQRHPSIVRDFIISPQVANVPRHNILPALDVLFTLCNGRSAENRHTAVSFLNTLMNRDGEPFMLSSLQPYAELTAYISQISKLFKSTEKWSFIHDSVSKLIVVSKQDRWKATSKQDVNWRTSVAPTNPLFDLLLAHWPASKALMTDIFVNNIAASSIETNLDPKHLGSRLSSSRDRYDLVVYLYSIASPQIDITTPAPSYKRQPFTVSWDPAFLLLFPPSEALALLDVSPSLRTNYYDSLWLSSWDSGSDQTLSTPTFPTGANSINRAFLEAALFPTSPSSSFSDPHTWPSRLTDLHTLAHKAKDPIIRLSYARAAIQYALHTRSITLLTSVVSWALERFMRDQYARRGLIKYVLGEDALLDLVSGETAFKGKKRPSIADLGVAFEKGDSFLQLALDHTKKALAQPDFFAEDEYWEWKSALMGVLQRRVTICSRVSGTTLTVAGVLDLVFPPHDDEEEIEKRGILGLLFRWEEIRLISHRQAKAWEKGASTMPMSSLGLVELGGARDVVRRCVEELDKFDDDRHELYALANARFESGTDTRVSQTSSFSLSPLPHSNWTEPSICRASWAPRFIRRCEGIIFTPLGGAKASSARAERLRDPLEIWLRWTDAASDTKTAYVEERVKKLRRFGEYHASAFRNNDNGSELEVYLFDEDGSPRPEVFNSTTLLGLAGIKTDDQAIVPPRFLSRMDRDCVGDLHSYYRAIISSRVFSRVQKSVFARVLATVLEASLAPPQSVHPRQTPKNGVFSASPPVDVVREVQTRNQEASFIYWTIIEYFLQDTITPFDVRALQERLSSAPLSPHASPGAREEVKRVDLTLSKILQASDTPALCLSSAKAIILDKERSAEHRQVFRAKPLLERLPPDEAKDVLMDFVNEVRDAYTLEGKDVGGKSEGGPRIKITTVKLIASVIAEIKVFSPEKEVAILTDLALTTSHEDVTALVVQNLIEALSEDSESIWAALKKLISGVGDITRAERPLTLHHVSNLILHTPIQTLPSSRSIRERWANTFIATIMETESSIHSLRLQHMMRNLGATPLELDVLRQTPIPPLAEHDLLRLFNTWQAYLPVHNKLAQFVFARATAYDNRLPLYRILEAMKSRPNSWSTIGSDTLELTDFVARGGTALDRSYVEALMTAYIDPTNNESRAGVFKGMVLDCLRLIFASDSPQFDLIPVSSMRGLRKSGDLFMQALLPTSRRARALPTADEKEAIVRQRSLLTAAHDIIWETYLEESKATLNGGFTLLPSIIRLRFAAFPSLEAETDTAIQQYTFALLELHRFILSQLPHPNRLLPYLLKYVETSSFPNKYISLRIAESIWSAPNKDKLAHLDLAAGALRSVTGRGDEQYEGDKARFLKTWLENEDGLVVAVAEELREG